MRVSALYHPSPPGRPDAPMLRIPARASAHLACLCRRPARVPAQAVTREVNPHMSTPLSPPAPAATAPTRTEPDPTASAASPAAAPPSALARIGMTILLVAVGILLAVVILTPIALSSHDLINWAAAPTGLHQSQPWPILVFLALDAAAGVCVLITVYSAWRGEPAGIFGVLVWCFALGSAWANFRHNTQPGAAPDAICFFPAMSLAGPALLEAVLGRVRRWFQRQTGRRNRAMPAFGWRRWTPGLGATRDTYGAYRTALLLGIDTVDAAITAYHQLCPDGSLRVATALRVRHAAEAAQAAEAAEAAQQQAKPRTGPAAPDGVPARPPVDLMKRIPVDADAYRRWLDVWADLGAGTYVKTVAERHGYSRREVEFVRAAGQYGLLDSETPPALRMVQMATSTNHNGAAPTAPATTS